jgi:hypothetical protein
MFSASLNLIRNGNRNCCHTYVVRVFDNRVLRKIFGPKRDEVTIKGGGGNCITRTFVIAKYNWNFKVEENVVGGACSASGEEQECP